MSLNYENLEENFVEIDISSNVHYRIIKETLTRIGIGDSKKKKLYKTCHIVEKNNKYYIVHFKELFLIDKKAAYFSEGDLERRNKIAKVLEEWGLCKIVNKDAIWDSYGEEISKKDVKIFILSYAQKNDWELITMYKKINEEDNG